MNDGIGDWGMSNDDTQKGEIITTIGSIDVTFLKTLNQFPLKNHIFSM